MTKHEIQKRPSFDHFKYCYPIESFKSIVLLVLESLTPHPIVHQTNSQAPSVSRAFASN